MRFHTPNPNMQVRFITTGTAVEIHEIDSSTGESKQRLFYYDGTMILANVTQIEMNSPKRKNLGQKIPYDAKLAVRYPNLPAVITVSGRSTGIALYHVDRVNDFVVEEAPF